MHRIHVICSEHDRSDACQSEKGLISCRYTVDYRASGFNHWGYQAGCEFAQSPAKEVKASDDSAVQRFTCRRDVPTDAKCTVDLTSLGVCVADASLDGLNHVQVRCRGLCCSSCVIVMLLELLSDAVLTLAIEVRGACSESNCSDMVQLGRHKVQCPVPVYQLFLFVPSSHIACSVVYTTQCITLCRRSPPNRHA